MNVDDYGRVILDAEEIVELLIRGDDISGIMASDSDEIRSYNRLCRYNDKTTYMIETNAETTGSVLDAHYSRQGQWFLPPKYQELNIWTILRDRCVDQIELNRLEKEKQIYIDKGLETLLRLMMYLVDHFRENKIICGVGRGSSVASFALYLIGITKINPIKYGLEIEEFLRD